MNAVREKLKELLMQAYDAWHAEEASTADEWDYFADHLLAHGVTVAQQPQTNEDAIRAVNGEALVAFITRQWVLCVDVCECCEHSVWDIVEGRHCALGGVCPPVVWEKALKRWMQKPFKMSPRWEYPPALPKGE